MSLPNGFFGKILMMDCETSGLAFNSYDPSIGFQSVSWGLIVADAITLDEIDSLYVEIKWDGVSEWSPRAEKVHGLTKEYLNENGLDEDEAAAVIATFIYKYWPIDAELSSNRNIRCAGHNVATFDIWFMRRLLDKYDIMFPTGNRFIDTSAIGWAVLNAYTSDELFQKLGLGTRGAHNALEDAKLQLESLRIIKRLTASISDNLGEVTE